MMDQIKGFVCVWVLLILASGSVVTINAQLDPNFYASTCPNVKDIVRGAVQQKLSETVITLQATLRLFFHDCFSGNGCDAGIMISGSGGAERDAPDNLSLAGDGFDTVIKAKAAVDAQCGRGIVSCADVLALAGRDAVVLAGGPDFDVELGRLDGLSSSSSTVDLPGPNDSLDTLLARFAAKGLDQIDLIALSGAHTIGFSHCDKFSDRLSPRDSDMDQDFGDFLSSSCPANVDPGTVVPNDVTTSFTFDNVFYQNLLNKKGLLRSDMILSEDDRTKDTVSLWANNQDLFFAAFGNAMVKMGRFGAGNPGNIRNDCNSFN